VVDFVEICSICARKAIIKAAKRTINSDKMCRSYTDLNFGVTFLEHSVCEIFASDRRALHFNAIAGSDSLLPLKTRFHSQNVSVYLLPILRNTAPKLLNSAK